MLACGQAGRQIPPCLALAVFQAHITLGSARAHLSVMFRLERLGTRIVDLIHRTRHIETLHHSRVAVGVACPVAPSHASGVRGSLSSESIAMRLPYRVIVLRR